MPTFRAVSSARGNIAGIVRALETRLGLGAGELAPRVAVALGETVGAGVALIGLAHEVVQLYRTLNELNSELDRLGLESRRRRQLEREAAAIALRLAEIDTHLVMPPMWARDP